MRIFAFSILFGWFTPIFLSSKNPVMIVKRVNFYFQKPLIHSKNYHHLSRLACYWLLHTFIQVWVNQVSTKFFDDLNGIQVSTALKFREKPHVSNVITNQWTLTRNPRQIINNYLIMTNQFTTVPVQVNYTCHSIYFTSINYEIWQVTTVTIDIWHPYNLVSPGKNH